MPYSHKTGLKNYNPLQMFFSLLQTLRQLPGGTNADRPVSIINHFAGPRALRLSQHAHRRIIHRHGGGFPRPAEPCGKLGGLKERLLARLPPAGNQNHMRARDVFGMQP